MLRRVPVFAAHSSILAVRSDDRRRHISLTSNLCLCLPVGNQLAAMGHQRYDPQLVLITLTHSVVCNDACAASYSGLQMATCEVVEVHRCYRSVLLQSASE